MSSDRVAATDVPIVGYEYEQRAVTPGGSVDDWLTVVKSHDPRVVFAEVDTVEYRNVRPLTYAAVVQEGGVAE